MQGDLLLSKLTNNVHTKNLSRLSALVDWCSYQAYLEFGFLEALISWLFVTEKSPSLNEGKKPCNFVVNFSCFYHTSLMRPRILFQYSCILLQLERMYIYQN